MTKYRAYSYAAGTIVNAIATGKGAAFALDLSTQVELELMDGWSGDRIEVYSSSREDKSFSELCVSRALEWCGKSCGARLSIESDIPVAQGLSSSSALSNAIFLAAAKASRLDATEDEIIQRAVDCSIEGGVSITGAFDDASASFLGGITVTDNLKRKLIRRERFPPNHSIILLVSDKKAYTRDVDKEKIRLIGSYVELAYRKALEGDFFNALTLNGLLYTGVLGYSPEPIYAMLSSGAKAAGLSGTGSAYIAIAEKNQSSEVAASVEEYGRVIKTRPRNTGAKAMPVLP
ncbi:MAG: shikimate kinase [Candidatus Altiarchaeales archaeon ex4484_2]|nr:MAG: shikimate kinase [Candidatus Altiarchaeales archaeon ex4484_2]